MFQDAFSVVPDPRMDRFLLRTFPQLVLVQVSYLLLVTKIGPYLMKNVEPFNLKRIMIVYNVVQIILNAYLFLMGLTIWDRVSVFCMNYDTTDDPTNLLILDLHHYYLLLKHLDLLETFFFVLRKKERQISFLHLYHHVNMLLAPWISARYFPGGHGYFVNFFNSFTHCIMYSYYLTSVCKPEIAQTKWKRYLTLVQIIQQVLVFVCFLPVMFNPNCSYPKGWTAVFLVNVLIVTGLFVKFYKNNYVDAIKPKTK